MRVAVVGGGIAGLGAALRLRDRLGPAAEITVYEQDRVLGGKLRTGSLAGVGVELGADAFLVREPGAGREPGGARESGAGRGPGAGESAAVALARRVGLADALVHPQPVPAGLLLDGELRRIPGGTLVGVPGDLAAVTAVAQPGAGLDRDGGRPLLAAGEDVAVGELVRRRLGDQVVDRLVDPMLGGVYAGRADALSLAATMPALAAACRTEPTLVGAVQAALPPRPEPAGNAGPPPVFAGVRGGLGRLVAAVAAASGATVRLGLPVRALTPADRGSGRSGWRLTVGATRHPDNTVVEADGVVLAVPSRPAARLLRAVDPAAADLVGALGYASVALVTLALPGSVALPAWSGFLVPASAGTATKAATFLTRKWGSPDPDRDRAGAYLCAEQRDPDPDRDRDRAGAYLCAEQRGPAPDLDLDGGGDGDGDDGPVLVRASVGRYGEPGPLRLTDAALAARVHAELAAVLGGLPEPVATRVQRWGGALPQYPPGHLDRVAAARAALPPTLRLAGAGYDGVGIPACVRSGETAADRLAAALEESGV